MTTAVGPFIGGWLIGVASWRLVFFINVPLVVAVVLMSLRHVPESRAPGLHGRLDVTGAVIVTGGLSGLAYGLIEGPTRGWTSPAVLATGLVLLALVVPVERRVADPLLPPGIFRSAQFSAANAVTFGRLLRARRGVLPAARGPPAGVRLQRPPGRRGLQPVTVIMLLLSSRSGALATRIGPRLQMTVGPLVIAAGLTLLVRVDMNGDYLTEVCRRCSSSAWGSPSTSPR